MRRLFGIAPEPAPKPAQPQVTLADGIKKIDDQGNMLDARIKSLEVEIIKQRDIMNKSRNPGAQNMAKQRAIRLLQQKKTLENQRMQLMNQSFNMEQAQFATESMRNTMMQVQVMREANQVMASQFGEMDIDDIEDLQDELEEMMYQTNEIQEVMSRSYAMPDFDEGELEAELQGLELDFEDEADELPSYLTDVQVPTHTPTLTPAQPQAAPLPTAPTRNVGQ